MSCEGDAPRMNHQRSYPTLDTSRLLRVAAGALAVAIFLVDAITPLDIAVAVLYVVVVLIAANLLDRRGVLLVSGVCLVLTVVAYLMAHGLTITTALGRCLMSVSAIGITTYLALKNQAAGMGLREQARLLDLTHDTIFVRDMHDTITYWNRAAEELYGWQREQAVGKHCHQLMQTTFPAPLKEIMVDLLRAGHWEGELTHTKRNGMQVLTSSRWSLQRDARGRPVEIMETNTDITERRRAQEALNQAQEELAHVTRVTTLGELTASIAHEVNQPLAAIVTNGQACLRWLGRDVPVLDEARGTVTRIIADADRASEVIRRIRTLARKSDTKRAWLNLNDVIDEVLLLVRHEVSSHRISLLRELASGLPPVLGDQVQLQQVLINLVINGIQAMATVIDRPRELLIRSRQEADQLLIAVRDSGIGIAHEQMSQVFDTFFTTKADGMGMGLSICRSIIEAHGGQVWASSNDGPGVTFQFTLPSIQPSSPEPGAAANSRFTGMS
jgi:two-component system, LuxR family, sensor kinase FixL